MKVHHHVFRDAAKRNHQTAISLGYEICQKIYVTAILVRNHAICYFCYFATKVRKRFEIVLDQ